MRNCELETDNIGNLSLSMLVLSILVSLVKLGTSLLDVDTELLVSSVSDAILLLLLLLLLFSSLVDTVDDELDELDELDGIERATADVSVERVRATVLLYLGVSTTVTGLVLLPLLVDISNRL